MLSPDGVTAVPRSSHAGSLLTLDNFRNMSVKFPPFYYFASSDLLSVTYNNLLFTDGVAKGYTAQVRP